LPHATALFSDYVYHFDRVSQFYRWNPASLESFSQAAAQVDFPPERRAALVQVLAGQNGSSPALELLARPGTVVVATGQQAGLFSGPCYTIYKALTAARLAERLRGSGIPAVPVFWMATEDHDFEEAAHCWVFDASMQASRLAVAPRSEHASRPVGALPVGGAPLEQLRAALSGFPFGGEVSAWVSDAYAPGETFGSAFRALLQKLLAPFGILFFDPLGPGERHLGAPLLRRAVERMPELSRALMERSAGLVTAGYHAQVHVEKDTSLVFLLEGGRRLALRRGNAHFTANGRQFSAAELADRAESLSPNALLRPVLQDYILPTAAFVAGPAEITYLAQSAVLYQDLLERMPVFVARQAFTLLDARSEKLLRRYRLSLPDFFHGEEALRTRVAAALTPPSLDRALEAARTSVDDPLSRLRESLVGFDPTLAAAFDTSRRKIAYQLSKIEAKARRESLRRDLRAQHDAAYLSALLLPQRHLQERFYSILPFLAQHGPDLLPHLCQSIDLDCRDHRLLTLPA
jgi:bacillithiol biosynthesis cysteine-adding enzyme BshC